MLTLDQRYFIYHQIEKIAVLLTATIARLIFMGILVNLSQGTFE